MVCVSVTVAHPSTNRDLPLYMCVLPGFAAAAQLSIQHSCTEAKSGRRREKATEYRVKEKSSSVTVCVRGSNIDDLAADVRHRMRAWFPSNAMHATYARTAMNEVNARKVYATNAPVDATAKTQLRRSVRCVGWKPPLSLTDVDRHAT